MDSPELKVLTHDLGVETETAYVIPLSDLHIGAKFDEKKFIGYRDWILERPNAYTVINGDVLEMAVKNSVGDTYGTMRPKEQKELAVKLLKPLADEGRILAYLDGNHEWRTAKDTDEYPGEYICNMLGIPEIYHADGIFLFLNVGHNRDKGKKNRICYTAYMIHGSAGGKKVGGKANALADLQGIALCDLYISSHTHQKLVFSKRIILPDTRTKTVNYKKQTYVSSGSFLEYDGYAIRKAYTPVTLGSPRIRLNGCRKDVHVSI